MEDKLFEDFKAGEKEQTIRNRMALIETFFTDLERMVADLD